MKFETFSRKTIIFCCFVFCTAAWGQSEKQFAGSTEYYKNAILNPLKIFSEDVDKFSGNLSAKINVASIRGSGGFPMKLSIDYTKKGVGNAFGSTENPLGLSIFGRNAAGAWRLNYAPSLIYNEQSPDKHFCAPGAVGGPSLDRAGERIEFFEDGKTLRTKDNWRLICEAGSQVLQSPDGVSYRMSNVTEVQKFSQYIYQPELVIDRNNNTYSIAYAPGPACMMTGEVMVMQPVRMKSNDGGELSFSYENGGTPCSKSRLARINTPGGVWRLEYTGELLSRVFMPTNDAYQFDYVSTKTSVESASFSFAAGDERIGRVTLPTGGWISYEYGGYSRQFSGGIAAFSPSCDSCRYGQPPNEFGAGWDNLVQQNSWEFPSANVVKRMTSDGGVWSYEYDKPVYTSNQTSGRLDVTVINGPVGREVHRFYGLGYFTPPELGARDRMINVCNRDVPSNTCTSYPGAWMVGLPADVSIGDQYSESYTWAPVKTSLSGDYVVPGRVRLSDGGVNIPVLQSKEVSINGAKHTTTYSGHDGYGHPSTVSEVGPSGGSRTTSMSYLNLVDKWIIGQLQDESFPGGSTTRSFDAKGNLLSVTQDGVTIRFTYDAVGNVATKTMPRGLTYSYSSYRSGIAQTEAQPEGVTVWRVVDNVGNVMSETNREDQTTQYVYDGIGRITWMRPPTGNARTFTYTANSRTSRRGDLVETMDVDGFGRPTSVTLGGVRTTFTHDALGRKTFESNPGAVEGNSFQYDALNRLTQVTHADGSTQLHRYGPATHAVTNERGQTTTSTYRAYGDPSQRWLMQVDAPEPSASLSLTRNARDLVTSMTQAGLTRRYEYDASYKLTAVIQPETGTTTYGRDEAGNMTSRTIGGAGTSQYVYDGQNRLVTATHPGLAPLTYTYDKTGKMLTANASGSRRNFAYNLNGLLTNESVVVDGMTFSTAYAYTANDHLETITYPRSGRVVSYAPDVRGRPTQVSGYANGVSFWPSGQVNQIRYANGTTSTYGQNARLWPSNFSTARGETSLFNSAYTYDGAGNLTRIEDGVNPAFNRAMGYDALHRLTGMEGPWGAGSIQYSGAGNIDRQVFGAVSLDYRYDANNRLSGISGGRNTTYQYDALGNINGADGNTYTYDAAANLQCINCGDGRRVGYQYDGRGQRVSIDKGGVKTYEIYDQQGRLLAEFTPGQNNLLVEHIYLGRQRIAQRQTSIAAAATASVVRASTLFPAAGDPVALTAALTSSTPGAISGTVTFKNGGTVLGTATAVDGQATATVVLPEGQASITAEYAGNASHSPGVSAPLILQVSKPVTIMPPACEANPAICR